MPSLTKTKRRSKLGHFGTPTSLVPGLGQGPKKLPAWAKRREDYVLPFCGEKVEPRYGDKGWSDIKNRNAVSDYENCARPYGDRWNYMVARAVNEGRISPEVACSRSVQWCGHTDDGDIPDGSWKRLPAYLWHVTTNRDAVLQRGVRSRAQLRLGGKDRRIQGGVGLGGGMRTTVSMTDSYSAAKEIKRALQESIAVAQGKITLKQMWRMARRGTGANREYLSKTVRSWSGGTWKPHEKPPAYFQFLLAGYTEVSVNYKDRVRAEDIPKDCVFDKKDLHNIYGADDGFLGRYWCPATEEQKRKDAHHFYTMMAKERSRVGGPPDPYITSVDVAAIAKLDPKKVSILRYKPCPGAFGVKYGDESEWKLFSSHSVRLNEVDGGPVPSWARKSFQKCPKVLQRLVEDEDRQMVWEECRATASGDLSCKRGPAYWDYMRV